MSSDDEIISTDDVDSTYDTADDFDDNEEFALTFDNPGRLRSSFRWYTPVYTHNVLFVKVPTYEIGYGLVFAQSAMHKCSTKGTVT